MSGANTIRKIAINCGAKHPELLTSTRFRKQIATTLQLLALDDDEMEQIATFMGHTKKTHTEFNRLPQDIYETAKVAKILLLMEKGKGNRYRGKKLSEINIDDNEYYSSEYEGDEEPIMQKVLKRVTRGKNLKTN
ncbi:uncharacterized protein LOC126888766 [Diabrotica virgifera virgifera]|uniref:Uncharacterized protein n=1 Tax=Diabrotica virgifera virgifera TaxID=50390 RepID=A0ABM5KSD4_DIAVI|nr:uncharacterized protein LOC126888766 [Diabrotica virgifera virgifera]